MQFETDIKPLFREQDRQAMDFMFDLWSYEDVQANADDIVDRLEDGSMPCDSPWEDETVQRFRTWMDEGCPP